MIDLFTSYYNCGHEERQKEIDYCLKRNIDNLDIDRIFLLIDDDHLPQIQSSKLNIIHTATRPTYKFWIEQTQKLCNDGVSILANSDIYFDSSVTKIDNFLVDDTSFIALSRWEDLTNGVEMHKNPHWSQDAWALKPRQHFDQNLMSRLDFPMGVPRCDNKIAYIFGIQGWKLFNPCEDVKSYHVHNSSMRTYQKQLDDRIIGGVAYVHPSKGIESPSQLDLDVWVNDSKHINQVKLNKSLEKWRLAEPKNPAPQDAEPKVKDSYSTQVKSANPIHSNPAEVPSIICENSALLQLFNEGRRESRFQLGYEVWKHNGAFYPRYGFSADGVAPIRPIPVSNAWRDEDYAAYLVPAALRAHLPKIADRPSTPDDVNFWQYPCSTEKQAMENHLEQDPGANIDLQRGIVNTYVGLPWATYIDKRHFPDSMLDSIQTHIEVLKGLAGKSGLKLAVHTVCQHIRWSQILKYCEKIGVTDLHISHHEKAAQDHIGDAVDKIKLHSWPLIAPNIEVPTRTHGLQIGKPIRDKRYLASFIGAHMPHYRSETRRELGNYFEENPDPKVLIEVKEEWHFEKRVYGEQVANTPLTNSEEQQKQDDTLRYNEVLSDSVFSFCPEGSGPNTLRFWESIAVGSIPVILSDNWIPPSGGESNSLAECSIDGSNLEWFDLVNVLKSMSHEQLVQKQKNALSAYAFFRQKTCF